MLLIGFILWIIEKIRDRAELRKPVSARRRERWSVSPEVWERCRGVNPTGKFNDVC